MTKIYVGNLPFSATDAEVRELFAQHGTVESVSIITDRDTGRPRGFGFVEMSRADASRAIQNLNGKELGGRPLRVNEAQERTGRRRLATAAAARRSAGKIEAAKGRPPLPVGHRRPALFIVELNRELILMGKGDPRTRRGKIYQGSFGKSRAKDPAKKKKKAARSARATLGCRARRHGGRVAARACARARLGESSSADLSLARQRRGARAARRRTRSPQRTRCAQ